MTINEDVPHAADDCLEDGEEDVAEEALDLERNDVAQGRDRPLVEEGVARRKEGSHWRQRTWRVLQQVEQQTDVAHDEESTHQENAATHCPKEE